LPNAHVHSDLPGLKLSDRAQAVEKSMLKIVNGGILDSIAST
jgi:hypothetical protein